MIIRQIQASVEQPAINQVQTLTHYLEESLEAQITKTELTITQGLRKKLAFILKTARL